MKTISELMSSDVEKVDVTWSALQVIALMKEKKIGSVVVQKDGKLIGIFTERDLLNRVDLTRPTGIISVGITDVMTPVVITVNAGQELVEVVKIMREHSVRHLPVLDEGEIVGIVSSRDLLEHYEQYLERTIERTRDQFASSVRNSRFAHHRFRKVFSRAKLGVIVTDTNEQVTSWNRFAESLLGVDFSAIEGTSISPFFGDRFEGEIRPNISRSMENEHPYHFETQLQRRDAASIDVALSVGSAKDKAGKVQGTVYIIAPLEGDD